MIRFVPIAGMTPQEVPNHEVVHDFEDGDAFESSAAVSGHLVELDWRYTAKDLKDVARREAARAKLGGFGFRA